MDSKIVFICGYEKLDKNITEGKIIGVGNINDDYFHATTLLNFAKDNYPDVSIFNNLNNRHRPETIAYFYTSIFNHIVFLNISSNRKNEIQKAGVFLIPDNITDKQKESLYKFTDEINDYTIGIHYNLKFEDGMVKDEAISSTYDETPRELFDKLFDIQNKKLKK